MSGDHPSNLNHRVELRVERQWLKDLDEWRRNQIGIPSRAASIRYLVAKGAKG